MDDKFWINEPKIILQKDKILEIWPQSTMNYSKKMNAITRFIIIVSLLGYVCINNYLILLLGVILVLFIVFIYNYYQIEEFEHMGSTAINDIGKHTRLNPLYNVLPDDYSNNVEKEEIKDEYSQEKEDEINHQVKQFIFENNKENKDIGKVFSNFSDNLDFESSMRQFYINSSTSIPNKQDDFLKYCYSNLHSEKPLFVY
tara:strand:+ start:1119 stop:1718 length:600 start_codon:yes stop_codon:yes gene_type:complete